MVVPKRRAEAPADKRPEKKQRSDEKPKIEKADKPRTPQALSVLREEETAFPRGGANVLTPMENRQIQIKAKNDVLFEQSTGKKASAKFDSDDSDDDEIAAEESRPTANVGKKIKKSKSKDKKGKKGTSEDIDSGPKIEGLSYRRLVAGSIVLGQVTSINRYDVTIALPNHLKGYLPLTAISDKVTQAVEALAAADDDESVEEDGQDLRLGDYLKVGQYLRVYVTKVGTDGDSSKGNKNHISLSALPHQVNGDLSKADLIANNVIQASIDSVEDHGLIMSIGTEDDGIKGFISSREVPADVKLADLKAGAVMLCLVLGLNPNGKTVKLSAAADKLGNLKKTGFLTDGPTVDTFLPGCAVEVLVSDVTENGLMGKVMGVLDVTADWIHSTRDLEQKPLAKRHPIGSQVKARVICTFPTASTKKLGVSLVPHLLALSSQKPKQSETTPTTALPISSIVEAAKVINVEPFSGLVMDVGIKGVPAFAHISRLSDEKVSSISAESGPYKTGTTHRARVVGYNAIDGVFEVSLEESALEAAFLQYADVPVGAVVKGTVQKLATNAAGESYVLMQLSSGIVGRISETHLSDAHLHNPEKRFKEGSRISARVLSVEPERRQINLTCKKSLVNSDAPVWKTFADAKVGEQAPGTIIKLLAAGAVVKYYGNVQAFLPKSQMSESFVEDPSQHFKVGQVVLTHPLSIDVEGSKMTVSCRDPSSFGPKQQKALEGLGIGSLVSGTVSEKAQDKLVVELVGSDLKAILPVEHLADGSANKCASAAKKIRVGQTLQNLLVLKKDFDTQRVHLSSKPALIKAVQAKKIPSQLLDLELGAEVVGFVGAVTDKAVFVRFAGGLTGLLPSTGLSDELAQLPGFGLRTDATVTAKVATIDAVKERFTLTQKDVELAERPAQKKDSSLAGTGQSLVNPVDGTSSSLADFQVGTKTKAKVTSVKNTQLNVVLADGVVGRIDVSEVFDSWQEIKNHKAPLQKFSPGDVLPVRVLGMHDHRNHKFLPITNTGKSPVFELSAKASDISSKTLYVLSISDLKEEQEYICFVNNVQGDRLWVNITPNVRGCIKAMDASEHVAVVANLEDHFEPGAALRAKIIHVDVGQKQIDLSARTGSQAQLHSLADLSEGSILPGRVTRISDSAVMVQLSEYVSGPIRLVELTDDYAEVDPSRYEKGQIVRVHVTKVDLPNKKLVLSTRPSKVLSSTAKVVDKDFKSAEDVKVNDVVRGFIRNVENSGVFVTLSTNVSAFVPVRELSDRFIKDWKSEIEVDQLVKGKIISVDPSSGKVQMSLKESVLDKNYKAPLNWADIKVGQVVTGKVRKVESYGVFIVVDNSTVSGLCHRSQIADERVEDVTKLYSVGDLVKAKVLKVDLSKSRRELAFGLKASYFQDADEDDSDADVGDLDSEAGSETSGGVDLFNDGIDDEDDDEDNAKEVDDGNESLEDDAMEIDDPHTAAKSASSKFSGGLNVGKGLNVGFDHSGKRPQQEADDADSASDSEDEPQKKKRRKAQIQVDRTAELDINGPQSPADFERLLMSEPNNSNLWIRYIAYYLQLSEIDKAREICERAVKIINHQSRDTEDDALNVWVAYLNLELEHGNDDTLEALFTRAKQYNDAKEIHTRLASIYILSGKTEKADELFQTMIKKFSQDPAVWLNYATFLFDTAKNPVAGRELLKRALQALESTHVFSTTVKFAQLEFKSENGDTELGRTMLEGLISTFPKRLDLFNVYLDLEMKVGDKDTVRRLFERVVKNKNLNKPKKARPFFKRWEEWEEKVGDAKSLEKARAKAVDWVRKYGEEKEKEKE